MNRVLCCTSDQTGRVRRITRDGNNIDLTRKFIVKLSAECTYIHINRDLIIIKMVQYIDQCL